MLKRGTRAMVRTGFFRSDPLPPASPYYFIDPEDPLFATTNEFRYTEDPTLRNPVLERSNVGMGMLLANSATSNLPFTNLLYRKLRDLEVNTLKRFTALTASDKKLTIGPMGLRNLLLLSEASKNDRALTLASEVFVKSLQNQADLALVVTDYFKPLVTLLNGKDSGIALASLANTSGCFKDSRLAFEFTKYGFVPTGGLSFALAKTPFFIGEFFALTHRTATGSNVYYSGLAKRWISPDAMPFLEVTSEHKLEVSEKDANALLSEHFLAPPVEWVLKPYVAMINDVFAHERVDDIFKSLKRVAGGSDAKIAAFATECMQRMQSVDPLALQLTLRLIKGARKHIAKVTQELIEEQGEETANFIQYRPRLLQEHIHKPAMISSLRDEVRVASRLLTQERLRQGLFSYITGKEAEKESTPVSMDEVESYVAPIENDYTYSERSDFPLSAHPKLRKFHPDFDAKTGLDHDPLFMAHEVQRWSDSYLDAEIGELRRAVTGMTSEQISANRNIQWD